MKYLTQSINLYFTLIWSNIENKPLSFFTFQLKKCIFLKITAYNEGFGILWGEDLPDIQIVFERQ